MGREESIMVSDAAMLGRLYSDALYRHPELRDSLRRGALRTARTVAAREGLPIRSCDRFVRLVGDLLNSVDVDAR